MDLEVIKKKISSYRTASGRFKNISSDVLLEILNAWEIDKGTAKAFAVALGIKSKQLGPILREAKKARRAGDVEGFREVVYAAAKTEAPPCTNTIEYVWEDRVIRFPGVDQLVDFLKKAS